MYAGEYGKRVYQFYQQQPQTLHSGPYSKPLTQHTTHKELFIGYLPDQWTTLKLVAVHTKLFILSVHKTPLRYITV